MMLKKFMWIFSVLCLMVYWRSARWPSGCRACCVSSGSTQSQIPQCLEQYEEKMSSSAQLISVKQLSLRVLERVPSFLDPRVSRWQDCPSLQPVSTRSLLRTSVSCPWGGVWNNISVDLPSSFWWIISSCKNKRKQAWAELGQAQTKISCVRWN